ncbi:MAG: DUF1566 domain-containing protein [Paludibacteraceae bacterium]|nr:DUF1566 domain-containing protein [Paludibacteraceae bacterium]
MKKFSLFALVATIVLCGFSSCEESASMGGVATYTGKVINEYTDEPLADIDVKVTNGDKIHSMTKTISDGTFSIEVRLAEINDKFYILIGNNKVGTKQVEIPAFGSGEYNVGTISIKGPTETPVVETTLVRVDGKNLIFCEGKVVEIGEAAVTERGICYGTSTPTIKNSKISCGEGKGGFSCQIEDIPDVHAKNYYIRAYATNKYGTSYGETVMIDHRNPYNLYKLDDKGVSYLVLPYDLTNNEMGDRDYSGRNYAQQACQALVAYDYDDWDLPTIPVLELIYMYRTDIGGFTNQPYWSSSPGGSFHWYYVDFADGTKNYTYGKDYGVRPVRQY